MVSLSWDVSLSLFVSKVILAVPNEKGFALTPNVNLAFSELSEGDVVGAGVFAVFGPPISCSDHFSFCGIISLL